MAHAYFITGEIEEGIANAGAFAETELGLSLIGNPDVMTLRHGLLSVDDARKLRLLAELSPTVGSQKVLIISASRLFHEAQNALLKLFEEPPAGTVLILILPAEGMLLPTLRSRLLPLPIFSDAKNSLQLENTSTVIAQEFLSAKIPEREKILAKLLDRTKSDKDEEKQAARLAAMQLIEGLTAVAYDAWKEEHARAQSITLEKKSAKEKNLHAFLEDLNAFLPILHERSAPLKLIFEHISLTLPSTLG